jgi:uncharacterized integral membrane protein
MADDEAPHRARRDRDYGLIARTILGTLILAGIVALAVDNRRDVRVSWIVGDGDTALWLILAITAVAGALLGWLFTHRPHHHR